MTSSKVSRTIMISFILDSTIDLIFHSPLQFILRAIGVVTMSHKWTFKFQELDFRIVENQAFILSYRKFNNPI